MGRSGMVLFADADPPLDPGRMGRCRLCHRGNGLGRVCSAASRGKYALTSLISQKYASHGGKWKSASFFIDIISGRQSDKRRWPGSRIRHEEPAMPRSDDEAFEEDRR